jgi:hypothetical protein
MRLMIKMVEAGWELKGEKEKQKKKKLVGREERKVVEPPHEVVKRLFIVEMVVDRPVVRVVAAIGHGGERKRQQKPGRKLIFYDFLIQFSSCLGHGIHPYL